MFMFRILTRSVLPEKNGFFTSFIVLTMKRVINALRKLQKNYQYFYVCDYHGWLFMDVLDVSKLIKTYTSIIFLLRIHETTE